MARILPAPPCSPFAYAKWLVCVEIYNLTQSLSILYASNWRSDIALHAALRSNPSVLRLLASLPLAAILESCHQDFKLQLCRLLQKPEDGVDVWLQ